MKYFYLFIILCFPYLLQLFSFNLLPNSNGVLIVVFYTFVAICSLYIINFFLMNKFSKFNFINILSVIDPYMIKKIVIILTFLNTIGLFFFILDKIYIRHYDYFNQCLTTIRHVWLTRNGDSPSSIYNVLGYVLMASYYPIMWLIYYHNKLKYRFVLIITIFNLLILTVYSLLIFSRSVLLFGIVYILSIIFSKLLIYKRFFQWFKENLPIVIIISSFFLLYSGFTFYLRMSNCFKSHEINNVGYIKGYNKEFNINLEVKLKNNNKINSVLNTIFLYMNQGLYNFQVAYKNKHLIKDKNGYLILSSLKALLSKLHIKNNISLGKRYFGAGSISLIGLIWYDFGLMGIFIFVILCSLLFLLILHLITNKKIISNLYGWILINVYNLMFLFSPICFFGNLMSIYQFSLGILILLILCLYFSLNLKKL